MNVEKISSIMLWLLGKLFCEVFFVGIESSLLMWLILVKVNVGLVCFIGINVWFSWFNIIVVNSMIRFIIMICCLLGVFFFS